MTRRDAMRQDAPQPGCGVAPESLLAGTPERVEVRSAELLDALERLWERSVRASHDFLGESDIDRIRPQAREALEAVPDLFLTRDGDGSPAAFMGLAGGELEMLFVDPDRFGCGVGRGLMTEALRRGVRRLCVNEQNPRALHFYRRCGFRVVRRDERDGWGNPFPILAMELETRETNPTNMEKSIAKDLLSIGAVFLRPGQPFTWASGIKSPIYCDNRLTLSAPVVRGHVEEGLARIVRTEFPEAEVLMGTSTAGIAHAAITATILDLPMGYVRSGAKDHGRGNRIEGKLEKGQKVVVIEDLISTGGSCIEVVEALREAGAEVLGVASIFTYGMKKGLERLAAAEVVNHSLSNLDALVEVAAEEGYIAPEDKQRLLKFRDNPSDESWMQ